jgi:hypothetical protein
MVARDMRRGTVRDLSGRGRARRRAAQGEAIAVETSAIGAGRMLRGELSDDGGGPAAGRSALRRRMRSSSGF